MRKAKEKIGGGSNNVFKNQLEQDPGQAGLLDIQKCKKYSRGYGDYRQSKWIFFLFGVHGKLG